MTRMRKIFTAAIAAASLGAGVVATSTPAAAWYCGPFGCGGGYGWGGGAGAVAAGVVGGMALGAMAASAVSNSYSCVADQPIYNRYGNFVGYRRVRVAC